MRSKAIIRVGLLMVAILLAQQVRSQIRPRPRGNPDTSRTNKVLLKDNVIGNVDLVIRLGPLGNSASIKLKDFLTGNYSNEWNRWVKAPTRRDVKGDEGALYRFVSSDLEAIIDQETGEYKVLRLTSKKMGIRLGSQRIMVNDRISKLSGFRQKRSHNVVNGGNRSILIPITQAVDVQSDDYIYFDYGDNERIIEIGTWRQH